MISCFERNIDDALHNVDSPITEVELVMQILRQLSAPYHIIVDVITNTNPFPSFLEAKTFYCFTSLEKRLQILLLTRPCLKVQPFILLLVTW